MSPSGFAIKLPENRRRDLIEKGQGTEFRFFTNGPIKREYVALTESILEDKEVLQELVTLGVDYTFGRTGPTTQAED